MSAKAEARPSAGSAAPAKSARLAEALVELLRPLHLDHVLELSRAEDTGAVHVSRRGDGLQRQELCFVRLEEAPPPTPPKKPPPTNVRIGGGFYIPELEKAAIAGLSAAAQAAAEERQQRRQRLTLRTPSPCQSPPQQQSPRSPAQRRLSEALEAGAALAEGQELVASDGGSRCEADGTSSDDIEATTYHFGTYTRGEARGVHGDRRQCPGKGRYDASAVNPVKGDAAFRVLSNERRWLGGSRPGSAGSRSKSPSAASAPRWHGPGAEALNALLSALGLELPAAGEGKEVMPEVTRTECCIGGRWRVELCYLCADQTTVKTVEKTVERTVEKIVQVPVQAPKPAQADAGSQASEKCCHHCGAPGHEAMECLLKKLQEQLAQLQRCQLCGSSDHTAQDCHLKPAAHQERCQLCCSSAHLAPHCRLRSHAQGHNCRDAATQTELCCQLCALPGHVAPDCPLLVRMLQAQEPARPISVRVGGGWLIGPEVPGLADGHLNQAEALRALAAAKAGNFLEESRAEVVGQGAQPKSPTRPCSAPRSGRPSTSPGPHGEGFAKKNADCFIAAEQMGPARYKRLEQERAALSERVRSGSASPERGPSGYLIGTYVQGGKNHCSSERGPRCGFRVYRSRITKDAASSAPPTPRRSTSSESFRSEEDDDMMLLSSDFPGPEISYAADVPQASLCRSSKPRACSATTRDSRPPEIKIFPPGSFPTSSCSCPSTRCPSQAHSAAPSPSPSVSKFSEY
eukprot:gb/GFBE01017826.1/.p1 GENE.gb/GFBE01017826.1/~~gb/GFBE01017826.1/.p1  ORF type:complete len:744 (+),score=122.73 gb/GFBE01017826.1/:1-2232(+)